jgi:hypothetical protein
MKQDYRWQTPGLALFNVWLMEFGDFAMERRMLNGIKGRAEGSGTVGVHHDARRRAHPPVVTAHSLITPRTVSAVLGYRARVPHLQGWRMV